MIAIPAPVRSNDLGALDEVTDAAPAAPGPDAEASPTIAIFGDSTAAVTGVAIAGWGSRLSDPLGVTGHETPLGCGLEIPGERRSRGKVGPIGEKCTGSAARWQSAQADSGASLALIQSGSWEVLDRRLPGDPVWRHLGDPVVDDAYRERFLVGVDDLLAGGAKRIVWLTSPVLHIGRGDVNLANLPENDPSRVRRYNELVREVAALRPEVTVLDYGALVDGWDDDTDAARRPDGIHLTDRAAAALVEEWLGPALLELHP